MSKDYTSTSTTIHREISKMKTFDFEKVNMLKKMVDYITNEYGKASNGLQRKNQL
jgi:hypothetical protein